MDVRAQPLGYTPEEGVLWYVWSYHWRRSIEWCLLYWICSSNHQKLQAYNGIPNTLWEAFASITSSVHFGSNPLVTSVCIFSNFSKVRVLLLKPMQLGNYKLGRQKLLAGLRIGSVPHRFPRDSLGLSQVYFYMWQDRLTDKKTDWQWYHVLYLCENYFFSFIFQSCDVLWIWSVHCLWCCSTNFFGTNGLVV